MPTLNDLQLSCPFKPEEKRPMLIRKQDYPGKIWPPDNALTSDIVYTIISTDTFTFGIFELAPGSSFDPWDIHPGDEAYYLLNGRLTMRGENGVFQYLEEKDGAYIPFKAWHKAYNFEDIPMRVLYFITPRAWDENIVPEGMLTDGSAKQFKGSNEGMPDVRSVIQYTTARSACTDDCGSFPVDAVKARKAPHVIYKVKDCDKMINIHGNKHPMLMKLIMSNDLGHFGEFILPAGSLGPRVSEPEVHAGDAAVYCEEGPFFINLVDLQDSYELQPGDTFFLPAGTRYQLVNFQPKQVHAIFGITKL